MKKVFVRHLPLSSGLSVLCLLGTSSRCHAGNWAFEFEGSGTRIQWGVTYPFNISSYGPASALWTDARGDTNPDPTRNAAVSGQASLDGTITVTCTWTPSSVGEIIPKSVRIPSSSGGQIMWTGAAPGGATGSGEAAGVAAQQSAQNPYLWIANANTLHSVPGGGTAVTNTQPITFRVPVSLKGQAHVTGSGGQYSRAVIAVNTPQEDNRTVSTSRVGAPIPKKEKVVVNGALVNNPDLIKSRDEWIAADGTGYGHTRWSYKERVLNGANPVELAAGIFGYPLYNDDNVPVTQIIQATPSGGWSNDTSGTWNPSDPSDSKLLHSQEMPQGGAVHNPEGIERIWIQLPDGGLFATQKDAVPKGWLNTPSTGTPNPVIVEHKLTDNADGTIAKSKYVLNLHDEWENPTDDTRISPPNAPTEQGVSYEEQYLVPQGAIAVTKDTEATWQIGQTTDFVVELKAFFEASFGLGDWGKIGGNAEAKQTINRQNVLQTQAGKPSEIAAFNGHDALNARYLSVVVYQAKRAHKLVDHFGASGFLPHSATTSWVDPATNQPMPKSDPRWGKTPQSKIDSLTSPRADWWPFTHGQAFPQEGQTGTWYKSGQVS